ncbi:hypothetical protein REJC140_03608 [Pseudorhizobium endolithicum]|uniref:Transcriptional regulator n=2 Tax=Pseudorhizobium endolithicum TaxID=1191678 RepID=A0ABN7JLG3_9HYPH|nr:hypothetical protein REJC140_03608 [Pseudorhizobium endolithicum]
MASPLKFLRRIWSRGSDRKQDADTADDPRPEVLSIAGPAGTLVEEGSDDAARPAGFELQNLADIVSAKAGVEREKGDGGRANILAIDGSTSTDEADEPVAAAHDATEANSAVAGLTRKRRGHSKPARQVVVPPQVSHGPDTASDERMSLDEEIKVLKGQLASRLKVQNEQLKKMLERFER